MSWIRGRLDRRLLLAGSSGFRNALGLVGCLFAVACGDAADAGGSDASADGGGASGDAASPSRDGALRLNHLQAKATHNSYHVEKAGNTIPDWMYTRDPLDVQLSEQGVRSVEIDLHYAGGIVDVLHVPALDDESTCGPFADCLQVLLGWSEAHPGHHALFVMIEPKDDQLSPSTPFDLYADAVDEVILSVWPRDRIIAPGDVQGAHATLRDAVTTAGWPTIDATRDAIVFFLDEQGPFRDAYTGNGESLDGRLIFPDFGTEHALSAFAVLNDPTVGAVEPAVDAGFMVRTFVDSLTATEVDTQRAAGLASGAQVLTTDYPVAAGTIEAFELPDGTPSRCNPRTAPADCTPADIERL